MEEKQSYNNLQRIPEALFLALLTAGTYWIAFRYESAYLKAYGFPIHLVDVSLESILVVALILSGLIWTIFPFANFLSMLLPNNPILQLKVARIILMSALPIWHLVNYGFRKQDLIYYSIIFGIIILFEFIWPFIVFRDKKLLRERFIADEIAESEPRSRTLFGRLQSSLGTAGYTIVLLIFLSGILAHTAGEARAKTQDRYLISVSDPTIAVIRFYKNRVLCVRFNPKKHSFRSIVMYHYTDNNAEFKEIKIGPLFKVGKKK